MRSDDGVVELGYALVGVALLVSALLPRVLHRVPLSPAMVFVGAGFLPALIPGAPSVLPTEHLMATERLTELVVIVAVMGVGLALDRPISLRGWASTWRLLLVAMPLFIAAVAVAGQLAGLVPATALLVAAVCAPTDPVLASDVRVAEPTDDPGSEDDLRFALSSEAGANDGAAFPFVHAAMLLVAAPAADWFGGWVALELVWKVILGVACGTLVGQAFAYVAFRVPVAALRLAETAEAIVALAAVFLAYGLAEILGGYGFLSVFAAALAMRSRERGHHFHRTLHDFVVQVERLLTLGVLLLFGYALGSGLLAALTWPGAILGLTTVLVLRPLSAGVALYRSRLATADRRSVAFFGVKGIGSFYYLAFATGQTAFVGAAQAWSIVGFTVLVSVLVHGVMATPVIRVVDRRLGRPTPEPV